MMTEGELRELDAKVHLALYPGWRVEKRDGPHGPHYRAILPGDGPNTWLKDIPLPWYTTDIRDWEEVYALKPEWEWSHDDGLGVLTVLNTGPGAKPVASVVEDFDATGLAAYALGRARCVLAWAEGKR